MLCPLRGVYDPKIIKFLFEAQDGFRSRQMSLSCLGDSSRDRGLNWNFARTAKNGHGILSLRQAEGFPRQRLPFALSRMDEIVAAVHGHMDQMTTLFESLRGDIRKQWNSGSSGKFMDPILGFIHAVDWTEPWLIMLILFHFMLLILAITTRKNSNFQMTLFLAALMGVYFAEKINYHLGRNWKSFAGQNYFDHHGVFLSNVWSGPLLIISTTVLINTLITLSQLIVKWKRAELKHRAHLSRQKME